MKASLRPLVRSFLRGKLEWSSEHRGHYATDGEGHLRISSHRGETYMGATELLLELKAAGENKDWFEPAGRPGSKYKGQEGAGDLTLEAFMKLTSTARRELYDTDPETYRRLMAERTQAATTALEESSV